ncbi:DUF1254 domain-containing protein [Rhodococcus sp. IEGM 1379]|uniref:DUF1254 domain-containing protein n=1 Tax=Rhodococcus sp. IEGM 1379 TaxID=3047086 RepID=UPI0024B6D18E|nr:DUF1254 domain-containing protein [Rhodococcus sp. IEGM 1379]MDI9918190.1 DUF1254 domain-containing protein [Rhodococcus sp. IEGM 1379]
MAVDRETLNSISTPDRLKTRLGTMEFTDGAPSAETVETLYDNLDFLHGVNAYLTAFPGASTWALRQGFESIGSEDNTIVIFSELMDSQSLFLTANADTIYYVGIVDLAHGPMVVETPPMALGIFDDMWFHWIIDFGLPGPDRGEGGRFLLVPPDYDGPLPDSGFHVGHSRTTRALMLGRSFLQDNDPKPTADLIKSTLKVYPYTPGGYGTSVATLLEGKVPLSAPAEHPETRFVEASGTAFNTIPPSDFGFFELLNAMVQDQPATATDAETLGQLAAIGIVKGQPFTPDERMRAILDEAAAVGHATSRALLFDARKSEGVQYYPDSAWTNMLFPGGYTFETPPALVTDDGIEPFPPGGAKKLNLRTLFFYGYTGITPAMCMRLTGIGSQYLVTFTDTDGAYFDGAKTYKMTLPPDIPAARFWSLTLYDNQTRSMLQTPQRFPRAGSQSYPSPAADADSDGTTTVYFGPEQPDGVGAGNWIQSAPDKGFFVILRLYSPLPSYFDKSWRPSEIEPT